MSANDIQIGGEHYKGDYQHWDWMIDIRLGYLEGCATKYLSRWRKKNGLQDLEKACHYVTKIKEAREQGRYSNLSGWILGLVKAVTGPGNREASYQRIVELTKMMCESAGCTPLETDLIIGIATWQTIEDLDGILSLLNALVAKTRANPTGAGLTASGTPLKGR